MEGYTLLRTVRVRTELNPDELPAPQMDYQP